MDYEKAYKAVLKTATQWIKDGCTDKEKICLECVFPELRESEDERIRKEMIAYFAHRADVTEFIDEGEDCKRWISYLEKQKERKPIGGIYWHAIKKGEKLPCRAYVWNRDFEKYPDCWEGRLIPNLEKICVGIDTWYLPAKDVRDLPREGIDELPEEQKEQKPIDYPYLPGWRKNRDNNKPELKRSVLMLTTHGVAEGEWLGEKWCQYRWSCELKDGEVLYWIHLSDLERLEKEGEEKQKEQKPIKMEVYEIGKGTTICGQDYKCKKDYKEGNCWYIKDVIYHCSRDGYLNDQNGVSWSCTPEWFKEYIQSNTEWAEEEKTRFVSGQFLQCKLSFDEFKEGEHYWLEYVGDDMYVGRSDNILNQRFHITPRQLYTLFSQKLEEVQGPPQEEKQVSLNYEPPFDENPSDKEIIEALIHHLNEQNGFLTAINCVSTKAILNWLKKQKEQKPAWSEEDQLNLNWVIAILNGEPCDLDIQLESLISWLKSLRPSWKPSEEQMEVDLEKEIEQYLLGNADFLIKEGSKNVVQAIARHFAEWGAEHAKEQMMEEAVEGVVCYGSKGAYIETDFLGEYDTDVYGNPGDKVRVIVCKNED